MWNCWVIWYFFLIFWGTSMLFSTVAASVRNPTNNAKGLPFYTSWPTLVICWFFDDSHSDSCEMVFHCSFDFRSPDDLWYWATFHMSVGICVSSLDVQLFLLRVFQVLSCVFESLWWLVDLLCLVKSHIPVEALGPKLNGSKEEKSPLGKQLYFSTEPFAQKLLTCLLQGTGCFPGLALILLPSAFLLKLRGLPRPASSAICDLQWRLVPADINFQKLNSMTFHDIANEAESKGLVLVKP